MKYSIGEFYLTRHGHCKLIDIVYVNAHRVLVFERNNGVNPIIKFFVTA